MFEASDYLHILDALGVDTDQFWPTLGHSGRILRTKSGRQFPGLYFNRRKEVCYFVLNQRVATVEIDWDLWEDFPSTLVPQHDHDKYTIVPKPGLERRALRSLLGL